MDRFVIIHCDDIGSSWSANEAARSLLTKSFIKSGSIMVTCPWAYDFVQWLRDKPTFDIGIHLTLNCEWDAFKWGPVAGRSVVPTLCDDAGYLPQSHIDTARPEEVAAELKAQISTAISWGLRPTHLDTHMWMIHSKPEYYQVFIDISHEFGITPLIHKKGPAEGVRYAHEHGLPQMVDVLGAHGASSYEEMRTAIHTQLRNLREGVSYYIIHPAVASVEMQAITPWDWQNRDWNYQVFMDGMTQQLLIDEGITVTTMKDLCSSNLGR